MPQKKFEKGDRVRVVDKHPAPIAGKKGTVIESFPMQGLVKVEWDEPHRPPVGMRRDEQNVEAQWLRKTSSRSASKEDIPNYRKAKESESCGNCGAFEDGYCEMFDAEVKASYVCDEWIPEGKWKESSLKDELIKLGAKNPDIQDDLRPIIDSISKESFGSEFSRVLRQVQDIKSGYKDILREVEDSFRLDDEVEMLSDDFKSEIDQLQGLLEDANAPDLDDSLLDRIPKNFKFVLNTANSLLTKMRQNKLGNDLIDQFQKMTRKLDKAKEMFNSKRKS